MVQIRQKLVPESTAAKVTFGKGNKKLKICIHETDNTRTGADADAHARLQYNGNTRQASWHWTVDDQEAVQSFDHSYKCWHSGATKGHNESIGIEICVNSDGNYQKAVQNAAALVAKIMKDEKISINNVVQHNYYSGKNCPKLMRSGKVSWSTFLQMVKNSAGIAKVAENKQDTKRYRLLTGSYKTKEHAENAMDVLKYRFGWVCYLDTTDVAYRVKTGTFAGKDAAEKAKEKVIAAKVASVVHIVDE